MTIEELQGSLEAHEQRMNEKKSVKPSTEQALMAQSSNRSGGNHRGRGRGRNNWRGGRGRGNYYNSNSDRTDSSGNNGGNEPRNSNSDNIRGRGRGGKNVRGRGGRKSDKSHIQCYNFNRYGHFADECWSNNKSDAKMVQEEDEKENEETLLMAVEEELVEKMNEEELVEKINEEELVGKLIEEESVEEMNKENLVEKLFKEELIEETVLMVTVKDEGNNGDEWFLDTGCSTHMTGKKDWFTELDFSVESRVRFADDRTMKVEGVGKVRIKKKDGSVCFISGVLYVPGMKSNLLSIGQLLEKGVQDGVGGSVNEGI